MLSSTSPLTITYRPDLHLLIVRWLREVSQLELQQGYTEALAAAERHGAARWLVDSRRRAQSDQEMVRWLSQDFLPLLPQRLHQPVALACLIATLWQPTGAPATPLASLAQQPQATGQGYRVHLFGEEGAAVEWLQAQH